MVNDECYESVEICAHGTTVRWISFGFLQFHECIVENENAMLSAR